MPNTNTTDKDIVTDLLKDSKFTIHSLTMALSESSNPQLREILKNYLNPSIDKHFQLADLAAAKNWYNPALAPLDQLKQDVTEAQTLA
ncbi:MAG: spore coat protein [Desulfitobacteriaceae bacterium]